MLFQTPEFFVLMFSVMLIIALVWSRTLQVVTLLLASYVFYMSWNPMFIFLILFSTVKDYIAGLGMDTCKRRWGRILWLVFSCVSSLGLLAFFKYYNFFIGSINQLFACVGVKSLLPILGVTLPVGISFYTFQSMSYIIDVFRKDTKAEKSFLHFATYVAFFPQLVAGPILRSTEFLPQLHNNVTLKHENLRSGLHLFLVGLVKKVIIADNISPLAERVFDSPQGLPSVIIWLGALGFGIQIFCDFSGYTDMARGAARMLGFHIPINFNYPYIALSITEFWRRWHISLSSWLRDYLYIPLGGNRKGTMNTYRNIMITMGLGGLWHGANWNFVAWGIYQGVLLAVERVKRNLTPKESLPKSELKHCRIRQNKAGHWLRKILLWFFVQYFVFLGWLIFRVRNWEDMVYCIRKYILFDFDFHLFSFGLGTVNPFLCFAMMALFVIAHFLSYRIGGIANKLDEMRCSVRLVAYVATMFILITLWPTGRMAFIYFQF